MHEVDEELPELSEEEELLEVVRDDAVVDTLLETVPEAEPVPVAEELLDPAVEIELLPLDGEADDLEV